MSRSWTLGAMACLTVVFGTSFGAAEPGVDPPAGEPSRDRPSVERVVDLDRDCRLAIDAGLARKDELAREIERQVRDVMARVRPILLLKVESYAEFTQKYQDPWLMGRSDGEPIPRWAGYTLGWRIVEDYLRAHPEAKASSLVFERSEVIASATPDIAHLRSPTP